MNTMPHQDGSLKQSLVISYLTLRRSLGYLGIFFPVILYFGVLLFAGCGELQDSISAYYHTVMGGVFVAVVSAIAIFLYTYRGYDRQDRIVSRFAAICALGIALAPTEADVSLYALANEDIKAAFAACSIPSYITKGFIGKIHLFFAAAFFLAITYISLRLFTKSSKPPSERSAKKKNRDFTYKICGCIMLVCVLGIALYWLVLLSKFPSLANYKPVFFLESIALMAFGISWLTKGQVIFKDVEAEA